MFQLNAPKYRRGEPIVIVWDEDVTGLAIFSLADFVTDVSTMTIQSIYWDFGDGTSIESTVDPAISGQSHRYATPGRKTLRVEIRYSGLDWASGSFDPSPAAYQVETIWSYVDVVLDPNRMATAEGETRDATIPVSAGIQLTFEDGAGRTHVLFPFLNSSAPAAGAEYGFYQENTGTTISADGVQSAIREAVESFRYSYYAGFGRLQAPTQPVPRAFYLHTPADVHLMAVPSSSTNATRISQPHAVGSCFVGLFRAYTP